MNKPVQTRLPDKKGDTGFGVLSSTTTIQGAPEMSHWVSGAGSWKKNIFNVSSCIYGPRRHILSCSPGLRAIQLISIKLWAKYLLPSAFLSRGCNCCPEGCCTLPTLLLEDIQGL